jgi:hypothetical protein
MRRRLWWQLIILDVWAVEDRGTESLISGDSYNTQMLTNIDDSDFGPETATPLVGGEKPTDVSFTLCSAMASGLYLYAVHSSNHIGIRPSLAVPTPRSEAELLKNVQEIEEMFVKRADPNHLPSTVAARTVRLIVLKLWLTIQYPVTIREAPLTTRVSHEDMLRTAVAVMELVEVAHHAPQAERYLWWTKTYVQWHPLAVALAELCSQASGELADRAWKVIDDVYPVWSARVADTKRGTLWRPIRKLYKKAKAARLEAQMKGLGLGQDVNYRVMKEGETGAGRMALDAQSQTQKTRTMATTTTAPASTSTLTTAPAPAPAPAIETATPTRPRTMADAGNIMDGIDMSGTFSDMPPSQFLFQDQSDWFNTNFGPHVGAAGIFPHDTMDWSTWNEFVMETAEESYPFPPGPGGTRM